MSRQQTTRRVSTKKEPLKVSKDNNDTLYLIQNENEVLHLKNVEMEQKITNLKAELAHYTAALAADEQECDHLRTTIRHTQFTDDIRLEAEKRSLQDKIKLLRGNEEIMLRKINEAREASIFEEEKLPAIKQDKRIFEAQLWEAKAQNQGTKVIVENLQKQLEKQRLNNDQLVSQRKQYSPKERELSDLIEEKLSKIKNQEGVTNKMKKIESAKILNLLVERLQVSKKKESLIMIENTGLKKKLMKKRMFLLSLIRKKYLLFVKNKALQAFKASFRPLVEQQKFERILMQTRNRRAKNKMFRIWRSEAIKKEYTTTRYFQVQNTLEKIYESLTTSNLISTFNLLKYLQANPLHQRAAEVIGNIATASRNRCMRWFFSSLTTAHNKLLNDQEVEQSAKEQSLLLVLSLYFGGWAKYVKDQKLFNRALKYKYFKELKKLLALKKKRELSEMLALTHEKINEIDKKSLAFCHIKKETTLGLLDQLTVEAAETDTRNKNLNLKIEQDNSDFRQNFQRFCLLRVSKTLKKQTKKAFDIWRGVNSKLNKLKLVWYLLNSKIYNDVNYGFSMILKRRFEKLKLSIADKIESCEFSYNYLVKENNHIKSVLDNKLLEQEKSKFVNILHRLIRQEKEIKHQYFFKFLASGMKCWKFQKAYKRADQIIEKRVKVSVIFLLRHLSTQSRKEERFEELAETRFNKISSNIEKLVFGVFENNWRRNSKMKRILSNVFSRNSQLAVYNGYNNIKRIYTQYQEQLVDDQQQNASERLKMTQQETKKTEDEIDVLREKLASKEKSIFNRKTLACMRIYVRNSSNKYLNYFNRWRGKVSHEKKTLEFAAILQRKTRNLIKNRTALGLLQRKGNEEVNELKGKLKNFEKELSESTSEYDRFVSETERKINEMEKENKFHIQQGSIKENKIEHMNNVKVKFFKRYWANMTCSFVMRRWREHKDEFVGQWKKVFHILESVSRKNSFLVVSQEMREEILRARLKKNLSKIYSKKYRHNAGLAFKIWRLCSLKRKVQQYTEQFGEEVRNFNIVSEKQRHLDRVYEEHVNFRLGDRKRRKIFDFLKKYTRLKLDNNQRKRTLEQWLLRGYKSEFFKTFRIIQSKQVVLKKKADSFCERQPQVLVEKLFYRIKEMTRRKRTFNTLFLNKFITHSLYNLYQQFFTKTKNYYRYVEVCKKNDRTFRIQKVIETFEKKRKNILCCNLRLWRKNQYEIDIGRKLFKRITRKAINRRFVDLFYAWKLESQARGVLKYHEQQGEVKKRKVEIQRLGKYLQDFKRKKGLLLENEEGNFVMSPRFAKKKEDEDRKDKNMRYKFVSRLIMAVNGYHPPIKAYNNMQVYMKLREKYRKSSVMVLNYMRRPNLFTAFKTWKNAAAEFRENFNTMERKDLIKILNRQKDKMEMQYSHKLSVDEMIQHELNRYRIFAHQREKKEKLCAHLLARRAEKVKQNAFSEWRKRNEEMKEMEAMELADRGEDRIQSLEEELKDLQELEMEYLESNRRLREAVSEALNIAEMVKKISQDRDQLSRLIEDKQVTCESLLKENETLNSKLYLAQKEAMNLLIISGEAP